MKKIILLFFIVTACKPFGDCELVGKEMKNDECLLVVEKIPGIRDNRFDYKGINPITKKKCDCDSQISDMWWAKYKEHIEIGDTIIKKKGELIFSIHKKDTVLNFDWECDGKLYK